MNCHRITALVFKPQMYWSTLTGQYALRVRGRQCLSSNGLPAKFRDGLGTLVTLALPQSEPLGGSLVDQRATKVEIDAGLEDNGRVRRAKVEVFAIEAIAKIFGTQVGLPMLG